MEWAGPVADIVSLLEEAMLPGADIDRLIRHVSVWDERTHNRTLAPEFEDDEAFWAEVRRWDDAARLQIVRAGLGLEQAELAVMLGLSANNGERTVRRWEQCRDSAGRHYPIPAWDEIDRLCDTWAEHAASGVPDDEEWPVGWRRAITWQGLLTARTG